MLKIGSHVSMKGDKMLLGAGEEAVAYGENTFMIYTGAPQNTRRKPIEELNIEAGQTYLREHGLKDIVVHAPYIINIANTTKPQTFRIGVDFLRKELDRAEAIGSKQLVLHPGAHVGEGVEKGIKKIIEGLNEVLTKEDKVHIALETMAGKGSECGYQFEHLAEIISGVQYNEKLSVCFDTCHTHDAGYDIVNRLDDVLEKFDRIVGLDLIKVVHVNDSKNPCGARKDRHENIGFGYIGFETLNRIAHHKLFADIPKILETPFVGEDKTNKKPPYKLEIEMLRKEHFNPRLKEELMDV